MGKWEDSLSGAQARQPDLIPGAVFVDTQSDTLYSLGRDRAKRDPAFAKSILQGYAQSKLRKGQDFDKIDEKLDALNKAINDNNLGPYTEQIQEIKTSIRAHNGTQTSLLVDAPDQSNPVEEQDRPAMSFFGHHRQKKEDKDHIGWR